MQRLIDLHVHSTASDGTDSPVQLIQNAKKAGLCALALTDHDNINGLAEAEEQAKLEEIELIQGIEISTEHTRGEIHILGYWLNNSRVDLEKNIALKKTLEKLVAFREQRNEELFKKLAKVGVYLEKEDVEKHLSGQKLLCRPHFALAMQEKNYIKDLRSGYMNYLGVDGAAYVAKEKLSHKESIDILRNSNALVSIAHPFLIMCKDENERRNCIKKFTDLGLQGLETYYSMNSQQETAQSLKYCKEFGLEPTCGSDYHGYVKPHINLGIGKGSLRMDYSILEKLKERHARDFS